MALWIFYKPQRFSLLINFINFAQDDASSIFSITLAHGQKLMDPITLIGQEVGTKLI